MQQCNSGWHKQQKLVSKSNIGNVQRAPRFMVITPFPGVTLWIFADKTKLFTNFIHE